MKMKGFSLLEISVVLTSIALIVGAITAGYNMLKQSSLQQVIELSNRHISSYNKFYDQFGCLPGDCPNNFGYATAGNAGNFNGRIDTNTESTNSIDLLYLSGYGDLYPALSIGNFNNNNSVNPIKFYPRYWSAFSRSGNVLALYRTESGVDPGIAPSITAKDAYWIDKKIDDGIAGSGNVTGIQRRTSLSSGECTANYYTNPSAGGYRFDAAGSRICVMYFYINRERDGIL